MFKASRTKPPLLLRLFSVRSGIEESVRYRTSVGCPLIRQFELDKAVRADFEAARGTKLGTVLDLWLLRIGYVVENR